MVQAMHNNNIFFDLICRLKPIQGIQIPGAQTSRLHQNKYNIWSSSLQEEVMENLKGKLVYFSVFANLSVAPPLICHNFGIFVSRLWR